MQNHAPGVPVHADAVYQARLRGLHCKACINDDDSSCHEAGYSRLIGGIPGCGAGRLLDGCVGLMLGCCTGGLLGVWLSSVPSAEAACSTCGGLTSAV